MSPIEVLIDLLGSDPEDPHGAPARRNGRKRMTSTAVFLRARRGWSVEAKARLVEETLVPGANVSAIGRFDYRRLHVLLPGQPQEALPALPGSGADGPEQYRQKKAVWEASSADVTVNW